MRMRRFQKMLLFSCALLSMTLLWLSYHQQREQLIAMAKLRAAQPEFFLPHNSSNNSNKPKKKASIHHQEEQKKKKKKKKKESAARHPHHDATSHDSHAAENNKLEDKPEEEKKHAKSLHHHSSKHNTKHKPEDLVRAVDTSVLASSSSASSALAPIIENVNHNRERKKDSKKQTAASSLSADTWQAASRAVAAKQHSPQFDKPPKVRPPLSDLITDHDRGVKGHVSFLLDWAIIGHAKSATSFIMKWLNRHAEIATWKKEVCDLFDNRPANLVARLYDELPDDRDLKRGFKCPGHFSRRSIRLFGKHFKHTRIIVGVRHPVRWFESFYNFRTRHGGDNYTLPEPKKLIGACTPETDGICTDRANFHTNLAVFGKTNLMDPTEQDLIRFTKYGYHDTYEIKNPLFLYDVAQFYDKNQSKIEQFKVDLQHFLGLEAPMPEPSDKDAGKSSRPKSKAIDICDSSFDEVREELVTNGKRASEWIRHYLLLQDSVYVSDRDTFESIIKEWEHDPCKETLVHEGSNTK